MVAFWVHLLVNANYEDKKWRGMEIKRGEFVTSLSALASETGISVSQVRTCLNRMRDSKQITTVSTNKMTKITICNYDAYQAKCKDESQADSTQNGIPLDILRDNQIATMEEYKEGKKKEVKKEKKSSNEDKEKILASVNKIYSLYPSKCPVSGRATGKCSKDKEKIAKLLREHSEDELSSIIQRYVSECTASRSYIKNFSTLLNNLPDYAEIPAAEHPKPEGPVFSDPGAYVGEDGKTHTRTSYKTIEELDAARAVREREYEKWKKSNEQ